MDGRLGPFFCSVEIPFSSIPLLFFLSFGQLRAAITRLVSGGRGILAGCSAYMSSIYLPNFHPNVRLLISYWFLPPRSKATASSCDCLWEERKEVKEGAFSMFCIHGWVVWR